MKIYTTAAIVAATTAVAVTAGRATPVILVLTMTMIGKRQSVRTSSINNSVCWSKHEN
mgnify:CR=1 FL=1